MVGWMMISHYYYVVTSRGFVALVLRALLRGRRREEGEAEELAWLEERRRVGWRAARRMRKRQKEGWKA